MIQLMRFLTCCSFLIFLYSCNRGDDTLARTWIFQKAVYTEGATNFDVEAINPVQLSGASFLDLQEDGSYTSYFGTFDAGQWEENGDVLLLKPASASWMQVPFTIRKMRKGKLDLFYEPRQAIYTFRGYSNDVFTSSGDNPFSLQNNKWRLKPEQPESEAAISQRLRNHFRFFEVLFSWAHVTGQKTLNVNEQPGALRHYANGFELVHYSEQLPEWKACFYDTADVRKAYNQLYYLFYKEDLDWKDENRFVMFASAYRQMQQLLK